MRSRSLFIKVATQDNSRLALLAILIATGLR